MSATVNISCKLLPGAHARDTCKACDSSDGYLARYVHVNGTIAIRWACNWCGNYRTSGDLPRTVLPAGVTVDDLPLIADNTLDSTEQCAVCESRAVEYHHWAPTAVFPDWGHVHGVFLCRTHHREWHDRMRAHGFRWPHELKDAA